MQIHQTGLLIMYLCMYEKLCNAQCFAYSQECIECPGGLGHLSQCHTPSLSSCVSCLHLHCSLHTEDRMTKKQIKIV